MSVKLEPEPFADCKNVKEVLLQAMGLASVCWENPKGAGTFQSEIAGEAGDKAMKKIVDLIYKEHGILI